MAEPDQKPASDGKRRLPILAKPEVATEADVERPPWHWSAIGAVAIFAAWLPLAALVNAGLKPFLDADGTPTPAVRALMVGVNCAAYGVACFAGGFLVGRFGGRAGPRQATVAGYAAAALAWGLTAASSARSGFVSWGLLLIAMVGLGSVFATAGGKLGFRKRGGVTP